MFRYVSGKPSAVLSILALLLLSGCGGTPLRESLPTIADRLVARDFAQLLIQVESLAPENTALRMARAIDTANTFDTALREELRIVGYRIEPITTELVSEVPVVGHTVKRGDNARGANTTFGSSSSAGSSSRSSTPSNTRSGSSSGSSSGNAESVTYTITVGEASFRRQYTISNDGAVQPVSLMEAKGVDTGILVQDDSIFDLNAEVAAISEPVPNGNFSDADSGQTPEPIEEELIVIPSVVDVSVQRHNTLLETRIIGQSLLVFDNDSLVLGEANKRRVRNLVAGFDVKTDVFSVLGCVFQDEGSWTESATQLAIGRSERIRSELLYAGVPREKILEEACAEDATTGAPIIPIGSALLLLNRSL